MLNLYEKNSTDMVKKSKKLEEKYDTLETVTLDEEVEEVITKKETKILLTFDEYFQMLRKLKPEILPHHKAPMRQFCLSRGLKSEATKKEFDKVIKSY